MSEADRRRWDSRYADRPAPAVGAVALPPEFRPFAAQFPVAGVALDLACGDGLAAVWLARRGLTVLGVDVSPVAIARAAALAQRCGVAQRCRFAAADLDDGLPAGPAADVIVCHRFRDRRLDAAIVGRLASGGLLAVSACSEVGAAPGPFRARPGELRRAFASLRVLAGGEADGAAWLLARR
ncbi:class I SAM-dependent methyltransferase [Mycobacterium sp. MYCO198283]|uniref:class I SAM-dependent methyltransferase n=1 Tax=Mycobacterium sp. MYCO198283 TaxID=2883505 RepID=UPI001E5B01BF|nr:class I SAM-dependent methyltransferase [Mycobacterium sp. MYCO198283]MCG5433292.1 class I SAM-dependent methyltransferase [Mycobacterium sp. MYCO198283]